VIEGGTFGVRVSPSTVRCDDRALYDQIRPALVFQAGESTGRARCLALTDRPGYVGVETVSQLASSLAIEIDEAIVCPPHGLLVKGWQLTAPGRIVAVRVRCGERVTELNRAQAIPMARPDVIQALGSTYGVQAPEVGFMAYLQNIYTDENPLYLEVELDTGERAYKGLSVSRKQGLEAIRAVLEETECRYTDVDHRFDAVLGPAVTALNRARLAVPVAQTLQTYGEPVKNPSCSLVIPLYGRMDYLEYQIALLSADPTSRSLDLVYVLDEPAKRQELLTLADAVYARFRLPFRILLSRHNRGFGPASNQGLAMARAPYVAFVNSDVFPLTLGWTDRLIATLKKHPKLGAIGPRLLYADGSVQHEGCYFRTLPEYGGWTFVEHTHKGRRPSPDAGLLRADMITAACLLMATSLAREVGGFDEDYLIGDFEDADLCRRLAAKNRAVAVETAVVCHHLERQSQARLGGHWRMNVTLFNAWRHQRRWIASTPTSGGVA
jgi:hypothetical protein